MTTLRDVIRDGMKEYFQKDIEETRTEYQESELLLDCIMKEVKDYFARILD